MSTSLEDLSAEVVGFIISFCDDKSTLAALARTSKQLHRLTLPHLYRNISLSYSFDIQGTRHLRSLTLTLLQKPEIAALVRSFTIRDIYSIEHVAEGSEDRPEWTAWQQYHDLDHLLRKAIEAQLTLSSPITGPPATQTRAKTAQKDPQATNQAEEWLQFARAGYNEASLLALLLPSLINLQSLDVPFTREWHGTGEDGEAQYTHYIEGMLQRAGTEAKKLNRLPIFARLTDVMITGIDDKYPDDPVFVALCAGLPAVKRLYGSNQGNDSDDMDDADSDIPFDQLEPGSSPVELIHLRHSKLKSSNFSKLMHAPKCLKTLIYEIGNTWAWTSVQFPKLQLALNAQKLCLERLCLSHAPYYPYQDDCDELAPMTFSDFSALKHFRIASIYLYGGERLKYEDGLAERTSTAPAVTEEDVMSTRTLYLEVLPNQLETLDLLYCSDASTLQRILLGFKEILEHKAEQFPRLHAISIQGQNAVNLKEVLTKFASLPWKAEGVRFVVRYEGEDNALDGEQVPWGWDGEFKCVEDLHSHCGAIEVLYDSRNKA